MPLFAILEKQRRFDDALPVLQESLAMDKDSQIAQRALGKVHLVKGDYAKVIELGAPHAVDPQKTDFAWASMLATAYARTRQPEREAVFRDRLVALAERETKALYFLVMYYSDVGRTDDALTALERCYALREDRMVWTKDEPRFAAIQHEPRFIALLKKMKLPV